MHKLIIIVIGCNVRCVNNITDRVNIINKITHEMKNSTFNHNIKLENTQFTKEHLIRFILFFFNLVSL